MNRDALLVFTRRPNGDLKILQRLLAHPIAARLAYLQDANELGLEDDTVAEESRGLVAV